MSLAHLPKPWMPPKSEKPRLVPDSTSGTFFYFTTRFLCSRPLMWKSCSHRAFGLWSGRLTSLFGLAPCYGAWSSTKFPIVVRLCMASFARFPKPSRAPAAVPSSSIFLDILVKVLLGSVCWVGLGLLALLGACGQQWHSKDPPKVKGSPCSVNAPS